MATEPLGPCPLCGRSLIDGPTINKHHVVAKRLGGRETHWIHRVCHSRIHSLFTERELLHPYNTFEALRAHPELEKFIAWVRRKDPQFTSRNVASTSRRRR